MISCFGTSMVTTRRSIFTILSMMGIRMIRPGPFAPCSLPRRKITPRSYSRKMRMAWGTTKKAMTARMTRTVVTGPLWKTKLMSESIMFFPLLLFWFYLQSQSRDARDLDGLAGGHGRGAGRVPRLALDKYLAGRGIDRPQRVYRAPDHRFQSGARGLELRANARAGDEDEKSRRHQRPRHDPAQR